MTPRTASQVHLQIFLRLFSQVTRQVTTRPPLTVANVLLSCHYRHKSHRLRFNFHNRHHNGNNQSIHVRLIESNRSRFYFKSFDYNHFQSNDFLNLRSTWEHPGRHHLRPGFDHFLPSRQCGKCHRTIQPNHYCDNIFRSHYYI